MPTANRETLLCRYHYDSLDRLVNSTPFEQPTQRYYCKTRLATEIQSGVHRSILQHEDQLLAQQQREDGKIAATLLATDQQRSVLNALDANQPNPLAYSPYGHRPLENGLLSLLGFNGERRDPVTGHYHLGNGYRQFNPVLMRFNSPDGWSPFGNGGFNAYMYCGADPINRSDPTGHFFAIALNITFLSLATVGGATAIAGTIIDNKTVLYIGIGIAVAAVVLKAGMVGTNMTINSGITRVPRNRSPSPPSSPPSSPFSSPFSSPPPAYDDLFPFGRQNSSRSAIGNADIEMSSLRRNSSTASSSSAPPTYEEAIAIERSRMSQFTSTASRSTNQVGSSVRPSTSPRGSLQSKNAANIRNGRTN